MQSLLKIAELEMWWVCMGSLPPTKQTAWVHRYPNFLLVRKREM